MRAFVSFKHVAPCFLLLTLVLAQCGCRSRPAHCETGWYARLESAPRDVTGLHLDAGAPGEIVDGSYIQRRPLAVDFLDSTHIKIAWLDFGHVGTATEVGFSGSAGEATAPDIGEKYFLAFLPGNIYRLRLGFSSPYCADTNTVAQGGYCTKYGPPQYFIADLYCRP